MPAKAGEKRGTFEYRGVTYSYVACLVDAPDGALENFVRIREYGDRSGKDWTYQEQASTVVILSWFKATLDEDAETEEFKIDEFPKPEDV